MMGTAGSRFGSAARLSLVALAASLALAPAAHATFPGANGKIAFVCGSAICTVNPDGSNEVQLTQPDTSNGDFDSSPTWSADGTKVAFTSRRNGNYEIYVMSGEGTGVMRLTNDPAVDEWPAWSPDGQKIAFNSARDGNYEVYVMNANGSGQTNITNFSPAFDGEPNWSPDGQSITFTSTRNNGYAHIYTMRSDGLLPIQRTFGSVLDWEPNWSPDGQRIAFVNDYDFEGGYDVWVLSVNGPTQTDITGDMGGWHNPAWSPDGEKIIADDWYGDILTINLACCNYTFLTKGGAPDWQPLPTASYHHPQTAPQLNVSLVPAFKPCGTGGNPSNAKHAPPLATNSCNPPKPSVLAAVGTTSQSSAQMTVVPGDTDPTTGNQANVSISASLTDIQAVAGGDYNPNASGADLTAVTRLRLTDKANGYGGLPATATEYDFKVPIDCSSTTDPAVGSTCSANTTANTLLPGLIQEQRQAIVQAFRVRVDDSGANGIRGDSDDRIFATQGVFVP
jgi:hypothetical protein